MITRFSTTEDTLASRSAGWPALEQRQCNDNKNWMSMKVFLLCLNLTSSLIIFPPHQSSIFSYMCVNPCRHDALCLGVECDWPPPLREMKLQVMTVREDASIRVDFRNHTAKCQRAVERLDAPECVRVDVCVAPPVSQNAIHQGLALKNHFRFAQSRLDLHIVGKHVKSQSQSQSGNRRSF